MPQLTDASLIRSLLETDRPWSAYALADLAPPHAEHARWFGTASPPAVGLVYRAFAVPVVIMVGEVAQLRGVLDEIDDVLADSPELFAVVRPEVWPWIQRRYRVGKSHRMQRMLLDRRMFQPIPTGGVRRLGPADLPRLQALYADGEPAGEAPDFFIPQMLEQGVYFGIEEGNELVAAAGTHVIAPVANVGAVGNIYTRRDRRNRGCAARLTANVTAELLARNLATIVLNVRKDNAAAIRVYERAGYRHYCDFHEGLAHRARSS